MKEMVILNKKEQRSLVVLNQVEKGEMRSRGAADILGILLCQFFTDRIG